MLTWLHRLHGRLTGVHVCEEFTRWETKQCNFERPGLFLDSCISNVETITFTKRWQERTCTICGKIQQRELSV